MNSSKKIAEKLVEAIMNNDKNKAGQHLNAYINKRLSDKIKRVHKNEPFI